MRMNGCRGYAKPGVKSNDMIWKGVTQFWVLFVCCGFFNIIQLAYLPSFVLMVVFLQWKFKS